MQKVSGSEIAGSSHADHERVVIQRDYITRYDDNFRVPVWTAHRLSPEDLKKRSRLECFRNDQRLPDTVAAFCTDYDEPIFDRGHLVPNSDMTMSQQSMINTYIFSNMTPQQCAFNRGIWQVLEGLVRGWVASKRTLYIITGSVFDMDGDGVRDEGGVPKRMRSKSKKERVAIPSHQYKILLQQLPNGSMETMSVMLPSVPVKVAAAESKTYLEKHLVSIDDIERVSAFFSNAAAEARFRAIDEFDFYNAIYLVPLAAQDGKAESAPLRIEAVLMDLSAEFKYVHRDTCSR